MLLLQLLVNGMVNGCIYSLLAIGFGIVYRTTGIFHIAYGGLYTLSAYLFYTSLKIIGLPLYFSIPLSLLGICICGVLMEKYIYLPFYNRKSSSGVILIASLGLYIIIENLLALIFGNEVKIIWEHIQPSYSIGGIIFVQIQLIQFLCGIILMVAFYMLFKKLKIMKALWAMGDEPELINVIGLPFLKLRMLVFLISSAMVGIGSILTAMDIGMEPHVGLSALLTAVVSIIVGGIDNYMGWIVGGFLIAELQSFVMWKVSYRWTPLLTFLLLIVILLFRPQGILGTQKRLEEV